MDAGRAIALALLLVAATVPAGGGALRLLGFRARDFAGRVEAVLVSAATGFGVFGYALTLLGQARLLYAPLALAVPLALAAGSLLFARPILARSCFRPASPYGCGETR